MRSGRPEVFKKTWKKKNQDKKILNTSDKPATVMGLVEKTTKRISIKERINTILQKIKRKRLTIQTEKSGVQSVGTSI